MIIGIGTDVCSIERLSASLERTPNLADRLFYRTEKDLSQQSLAGRFAATEALAKALGDPKLLTWNEVEVANNELGKPIFQFHGRTAVRMFEHGVDKSWLSISHDASIAIAMVVLEAN